MQWVPRDGVTSLISYPALLAVGVPPLPANVANLVAGVACWPGSALTSRRELAGAQGSLRRGLPVAAAGSAAGAVLLLNASPAAFTRMVPFLVAIGSLALLVQPWLSTVIARNGDKPGGAVWPLVGLISDLRGLLGVAAGIMLLAALLVLPRQTATRGECHQKHAAWCWRCRCRSHLGGCRAGCLVSSGAAGPRAVCWQCGWPDHCPQGPPERHALAHRSARSRPRCRLWLRTP